MTDQIERVAQAIENTPEIFWRKNKANDKASMYEVCVNEDPVLVDPKVISSFSTEVEAKAFENNYIRAAQARAAIAAASEWQTIESAPKDGTHVLLYGQHTHGGVRIGVGKWVSEFIEYEEFVRKAKDGDVYRVVKEDVGHWGNDLYDCTHWQPLPQPPKADNAI